MRKTQISPDDAAAHKKGRQRCRGGPVREETPNKGMGTNYFPHRTNAI